MVVELGREPFELHLFQKSFIQGGQIQCCYNHDMKTTTMMKVIKEEQHSQKVQRSQAGEGVRLYALNLVRVDQQQLERSVGQSIIYYMYYTHIYHTL